MELLDGAIFSHGLTYSGHPWELRWPSRTRALA